MTNVTKFPSHVARRVRVERLASKALAELRADPKLAMVMTYADLLGALANAFEAADRFAAEHNLTPAPLDYLKDNL